MPTVRLHDNISKIKLVADFLVDILDLVSYIWVHVGILLLSLLNWDADLYQEIHELFLAWLLGKAHLSHHIV